MICSLGSVCSLADSIPCLTPASPAAASQSRRPHRPPPWLPNLPPRHRLGITLQPLCWVHRKPGKLPSWQLPTTQVKSHCPGRHPPRLEETKLSAPSAAIQSSAAKGPDAPHLPKSLRSQPQAIRIRASRPATLTAIAFVLRTAMAPWAPTRTYYR